MAVGILFDGAGVSREQYDQVLNQVAPDNKLTPGMLYHVAGKTDNGIAVVEVWESQAALDSFFKEHLGQALQDAKITVMPKSFEIFNIIES